MKITRTQLRRIIKEEMSKLVLESEKSIMRRGDTLYLIDDEGNESDYGSVIGSRYEHMSDGDIATLTPPRGELDPYSSPRPPVGNDGSLDKRNERERSSMARQGKSTDRFGGWWPGEGEGHL